MISGQSMTRPTNPWLGSVLGVLVLLSSGGEAHAEAKQECNAAYEQSQTLREKGKLIDARKQAVACSASTCSAYVVKECAQWLAEIDASLPTVVFTAQDPSGSDTLAVRVSVDGRIVGEKLDGKAVPIDPGEHVIRFELAGAEAVEQRVLVRQGQKNRNVAAAFKGKPADPSSAGTPVALGKPPYPRRRVHQVRSRLRRDQPKAPRPSQRIAGAVLVGIGGAGIVAGASRGGWSSRSTAPSRRLASAANARRAKSRNLSQYHAKSLASTLGFIGGAAVGGAGLVTLLLSPRPAPDAAIGLALYVGPGTVGARGRF